ncbi:hypothetical protein TGARI_243310B, partial [Toxoplasma gondii ARI]
QILSRFSVVGAQHGEHAAGEAGDD